MPGKHFFPQTDGGFRDWVVPFAQKVSEAPGDIGVSNEDAIELASLVAGYREKLIAASEPGTRTTVIVQGKSDAKKGLVKHVRKLARIIQAHPGTTDEMRAVLGLCIPDRTPTRSAAPLTLPLVRIDRVGGGLAQLRLADAANSTSGRKPDRTLGALIYYSIGPDAPVGPDHCRCGGVTTRLKHLLRLPAGQAGQKLWVMAQWLSPTGAPGPVCAPVSAIIAA